MEKIAFTEEQKKVIDSDSKRLLVLSCARSGKTATIIGRIQRLLGEGVLSSVFLVLSFSNKSADDIREKLERNIPGAKMTVQTFHSFGLDLIKKYHEELGYDKKIGIAMDSERKNFIKLICSQQHLAINTDEVLQYIRRKKSFEIAEDEKPEPLYEQLFQDYMRLLKEKGMVDMEDLIYLPLELMHKFPEVKQEAASIYRYIFVDEYQDTNEAQNRLLDAITTKDSYLCLVGDDDQAIYEWRGAQPHYIRDKAVSHEYTVLKLQKNFRSQQAIIDVANRIIQQNKDRVAKVIVAANPAETPPYFRRFSSREEEAAFVAKTIRELVDSKRFHYKDIAVLYRGEKQLEPVRAALEQNGIEYAVNREDNNFQYSKFVAVLKAIVDWDSYEDIVAAVNFPTPCFDKFVFQDAKETYNRETGNTQDFSPVEWLNRIYLSSVLYDEDCETFRSRYRVITQLRMAKNWNAKQAIAYLIEQYYPGYDDPDAHKHESQEFQYVRQTFDLACAFEESMGPQSLKDFVLQLCQVIGRDDYDSLLGSNAVTLMTIHRSKGLEYKVVFIIGVQVGVFPNDFFIRSQKDLEAERRLFYVAVTRAKNLLFLSSFDDPLCGPKDRFGNLLDDPFVKHGFMAEIPEIMFAKQPVSSVALEKYPVCEDVERPKQSASGVAETLISGIGEEEEKEILADISGEKADKIRLTDLSEEMLKEYRNQAYELALQSQYQLPDNVFIVVIGDKAVNETTAKQIIKASGFKKWEFYGYHGESGFNVNRLYQNQRCIGIIMGPIAHKLPTVGERSLKELLKQDGFPYTIDLIDERITKQSLKDALTKIKWAYFKEQEKYKIA